MYMSNIYLFVVEQSSDDEIKGDIQQRYMYYSIKNPMHYMFAPKYIVHQDYITAPFSKEYTVQGHFHCVYILYDYIQNYSS